MVERCTYLCCLNIYPTLLTLKPVLKMQRLGQQDDSMGKDAFHGAGQPEFHFWNPHSGRKEAIP